ncbi:MAG: hypothetical protein F6K31_32470 [Symploca sp. SIO2G7]|nr:hypothetical protein [Symploca sp. SIO2G7]
MLGLTTLWSKAQDSLIEDSIRWMNTGDSLRTEAYLFADEPISGACSQDCYDIDLTLYDATTKKSVAEEHKNTKTPTVYAPYEGDFILNVEMVNCARSGGCRTWINYDNEEF